MLRLLATKPESHCRAMSVPSGEGREIPTSAPLGGVRLCKE
jgi:hypothetical protein